MKGASAIIAAVTLVLVDVCVLLATWTGPHTTSAGRWALTASVIGVSGVLAVAWLEERKGGE